MFRISEAMTIAVQHHQAGRLQAADHIYRQVLAVDPNLVDALHSLGVIALQTGRNDDAVNFIGRAVQLNRTDSALHVNLGNAFKGRQELDQAVVCMRRALELKPDCAVAHYNLGTIFQQQRKLDMAIGCYQRALELKPDFVEAHSGLGKALYDLGNREEAASCFRRAIELRPSDSDAKNSLGVILVDQGLYAEAIECLRETLAIRSNFADARFNLGRALLELGCFDEAKSLFQSALELEPDLPDAHVGLSIVMLLYGDYSHGWEEYEWRWRAGQKFLRTYTQPRWNGEPLSGKTILLHAEQGLGDTLEFVRYAAMVKALGATVIFDCPKPLMKLLSRSPGIDHLVGPDYGAFNFDYHSPLLSLPGIFGTNLTNIPANVPYIYADDELIGCWRSNLEAIGGFQVAINWCGELGKWDSLRRAFPLRLFESLANITNVRLMSIHKGVGQAELAAAADSFSVVDFGNEIDTSRGAFMDTAAIMKSVDLVITSDTATAHLAGALGVRVWVALSFVADWRWMLNRSDSPWYPTMRLFRQTRPGDWAGVFDEIQCELQKLVSVSSALKTLPPPFAGAN